MRSLSPDKEFTTPLPELFERIVDKSLPGEFLVLFARGLVGLAQAQRENFPQNIFQDLDLIAAEIYRGAMKAPQPLTHLEEQIAVLVRLQRLYGCKSSLNFQYVHDFTYGFDWIKWAAKQPRTQKTGSPFQLDFLYYLERRAGEIETLIQQNDEKYPKLSSGKARNPFGFSREPADEILLHETLARERAIPIEAWAVDGHISADFQLYENRRIKAQALKLCLKD